MGSEYGYTEGINSYSDSIKLLAEATNSRIYQDTINVYVSQLMKHKIDNLTLHEVCERLIETEDKFPSFANLLSKCKEYKRQGERQNRVVTLKDCTPEAIEEITKKSDFMLKCTEEDRKNAHEKLELFFPGIARSGKRMSEKIYLYFLFEIINNTKEFVKNIAETCSEEEKQRLRFLLKGN